jgi:predicted O-methyltransferase YrrM
MKLLPRLNGLVNRVARRCGYDRVRARILRDALVMTQGQISLAEARFLGGLVAGLAGPGPVVEIGTLFGFSTRVMVCAKAADRELITVDNYSWNPFGLPGAVHRQITAEALAEGVESFHVRLVRMDKKEFFRTYDGPAPALVFLDADHSYAATKEDIAWARGVHAGTVCGHDYHKGLHPDVVKAVDEYGGPKQLVGTLWVL